MANINSSFDAGVLRVCYHGKNNNGSEISKETFENCIKTIYNCPVVCNYIRDDDEIGSHDVDIVNTSNGLKLANITTPVGVVPTGANYWWEEILDDDVVHEYLCIDVLIWKRQEAYSKLKENEITKESMEITVKDGEMIDGYYRIYDFEFTAFCLLGTAGPCFESASLKLFEMNDFSFQYSAMMNDLKKEISMAQPANAVDILHVHKHSKGGTKKLNKKLELLSKYNLTSEMLDFNIEDFELNELESKLKTISEFKRLSCGVSKCGENLSLTSEEYERYKEMVRTQEPTSTNSLKAETNTFSLSGEQFRCELMEVLSTQKTMSCWGEEMPRYIYVDYDSELLEVYCYDCEDWKLYGFPYSLSGDSIFINFECKKRKRFSIVDFDEGDNNISYTHIYEAIIAINKSENDSVFNKEKEQLETKYATAITTVNRLNAELDSLRNYKQCKLEDEKKAAQNTLFSQFEDIAGIDLFESLKADCNNFSLEELEEKCYAIRGRKSTTMDFSTKRKTPKFPVSQTTANDDEPYDGLFVKYNLHK